mgnify:CR=1 FL=1
MNNYVAFFSGLAVMAGVTYLVRMLPLVLVKKKIENKFINSFLYYVPYVTLSVMTFPAIINATHSPIAGIAAFAAGLVAAWFNAGLFKVSCVCCAVVFILEFFV